MSRDEGEVHFVRVGGKSSIFSRFSVNCAVVSRDGRIAFCESGGKRSIISEFFGKVHL